MGGSIQGATRTDDGASAVRAAGAIWEIGSVVADRFVVRSHVGEGRYGQVYKALDRSLSDPHLRLEQHVALHVLEDRIRAQTRLLRKLELSYQQPHLWSHANIVKICGFGASRGGYFFATEFLEGRSLRAVLDEIRPNLLSRDTAFALLRSVGNALEYAHANNVVHGDIRPETVFITTEQTVKVLDLLPASSVREAPSFVEDTAPNGLFNPDPRDDVYGLACLAYSLLSGIRPFDGASALEALNAGLEPVPIVGLEPDRWAALARGLALRRAHRTGSVAELLTGLGAGDPHGQEPARDATASQLATRVAAARDGRAASDGDMPVIGDFSGSSRSVDERGVDAATEPDLELRADPRGWRWQPSERLVAPEDVYAYSGRHARRRRQAHRSRAGLWLLSLAFLAALGLGAYLMSEPLVDAVSQVRGAVGFVGSAKRLPTREASATAASEPTVAVKPDRIAAVPGAAVAVSPASGPSPVTPSSTAAAGPANEPRAVRAVVPPAAPPSSPEAAAADSLEPTRFEFAARVVTVSENQAFAAVVIDRRGGRLGPASVTWWTSDGTAVAGEDYADLGRQVASFAAGEAARTILVPIVADSVPEGRESFYVNLAAGGSATAPPGRGQRVEIVIDDDD